MRRILTIILLTLPLLVFSQAGKTVSIPTDIESITHGRELFVDKCSKCHLFGEQKIGPSLASVTDKRPIGWLTSFMENSQKVITSGDQYAVHLYRSYNNMVMPEFKELTNPDMLDILAYIQDVSIAKGHDYSNDSVNYYDQEIRDMAERRHLHAQEEEKDYYAVKTDPQIPNDVDVVQQGRDLFRDHCESCHSLDKRETGPALASVTDRRPVAWLLDFIESPKAVMIQGDDYANYLAMNYPLVMPDFGYLTEDEKLAVLAYIKYESGALTHVAGANANAIVKTSEDTVRDIPTRSNIDDSPSQDSGIHKKLNQSPAGLIVAVVVVLLGVAAFVVLWRRSR